MTNLFVTGCTGFIGSNLWPQLVEDGYAVFGFVRHSSRQELAKLGSAADTARFIEGDLTDYHSVVSAVEQSKPEIIVHLGALSPVRLSFDDPFPYLRVNFQGTCNLVHAALQKAPSARVIVASTAEVYGWQDSSPIREDARLMPSSPYGVSKAAADQYVQMATRVYGLKATLLRCNNTYGRRIDKGFLVEYLITAMLKGGPVYIGAPDHIRDYMFIDDHLSAYRRAIENTKAIGQAFNVSPGNPISNRDVAKKLASLLSYDGKIVEGVYPPGYPNRPAELDTASIVLDSSKIRSALGWSPNVSLDEGLQLAVKS